MYKEIFSHFDLGFVSDLDVDTTKVPTNALAKIQNFEINNPLFCLGHTPGFDDYISSPLPPYSGHRTVAAKMWNVEHPSQKNIVVLVRRSNNLLTQSEYLDWGFTGGNATFTPNNISVPTGGAYNHRGTRMVTGGLAGSGRRLLTSRPIGTVVAFSLFFKDTDDEPEIKIGDASGTSSLVYYESSPIVGWTRKVTVRTFVSTSDQRLLIELPANKTAYIYGAQLEILSSEGATIQNYGYTTLYPEPFYVFMYPRWNGNDWVEQWGELTESYVVTAGTITGASLPVNMSFPNGYVQGWQFATLDSSLNTANYRTIIDNNSTDIELISGGISSGKALLHRSPVLMEENPNNLTTVSITEALGKLYFTVGKHKRPYMVYFQDIPASFEQNYPAIQRFVLDYHTHFFPILRSENPLPASLFERFGMSYVLTSATTAAIAATGKLYFAILPDSPQEGEPHEAPSILRLGNHEVSFSLHTVTPESLATAITALAGFSATWSGNRTEGEVSITYGTAGEAGNSVVFFDQGGNLEAYIRLLPYDGTLEGGKDADGIAAGTYYVHLVITLDSGTKLYFRETSDNAKITLGVTASIKIAISIPQVGLIGRIQRIDAYIGEDTEDYISMLNQYTIHATSSGWSLGSHKLNFDIMISKLKTPSATTTLLQDMFRNPNLEVRARYDLIHYLRSRMFIAGVPEGDNYIRFSNIRGIVEELDLFPISESEQYGFIYTDPGNADAIRRLSETIDGNLLIMRGNQVAIYEVSTGREFQRRLFTVFNSIGIANQNAIVANTDFGSFWYDDKDVYWYSGGVAQPRRIAAGRVRNWLKQYKQYIPTSYCVRNPKLNEFWMFLQVIGVISEGLGGDYLILRYSPQFENFNILQMTLLADFALTSIEGETIIVNRTKLTKKRLLGTSDNLTQSIAQTHKVRIQDSTLQKQLDEFFIEADSQDEYRMVLYINDETTPRSGNQKTILSTLKRWVRSLRAFMGLSKFAIRIESLPTNPTVPTTRPQISEFGVRYTGRDRGYGSHSY